MALDADIAFMHLALTEGRQALPACLPNPPVGCVLVRDGQVVAKAHTQMPGQAHAEAGALALLEGDLHTVTAYVTLEPCAFHGRTPSCAQSLIARHIGRVVVALIDPDPRNQGKGIALLEQAGVPVTQGVCAPQAWQDLAPHLALAANR